MVPHRDINLGPRGQHPGAQDHKTTFKNMAHPFLGNLTSMRTALDLGDIKAGTGACPREVQTLTEVTRDILRSRASKLKELRDPYEGKKYFRPLRLV